ncbi:MAG: hypothetical protein LIO56_04430 [Lachnospiraceae bacterium]|nr:hypothetical protein [Lachnospiraceae bacterium]
MKKKILTLALSAALTASLIPAGVWASTEGIPAEQDAAEVFSDEETFAFSGEQGDESLESADDDALVTEEHSVDESEMSDPDAFVLEGIPEEEISGDGEMVIEEEPADEEVDVLALAAHDAIGSYEELKSAVNGQTGTITVTLSESFATEGEEHIALVSGAEVTIDLNGCTIIADDLGGGALFMVPENTRLTIMDGQAGTAVKGDGASVDAASAGQLAELAGSIESGISLTYYVTESTVTDSAFGRTQETRYSYSVSSNGMICTTGQDHALFSVTGGTLNIESGFFYGEAESSGNRAIDASSGTVNLSGGYICGFDEAYRSGHGEASDGGAVRVTDSAVLNISDSAVLAANKAATGGAVDVANGGTLNMAGGVISGNEATEDAGTSEWNTDYGGGGIHAYGSGTVVNISGGYLTNNVSDCTGYFDGGGGILLNGATLHFNGGYITGNKAASSGGGIRTAFAANSAQPGSFVYITGGYLCANYAGGAEGGGFCLDNGSYAEITAASTIYINDNETNTSVHWGGGGVFCANGATLYMNDAMITENAAGGFGGGVAGCSTGRIAIADDAGAAIYGNSAEGQHTSGEGSTKHDDTEYALNDKVFMENGYQDYYCALESMVSGMMLGGGSANWHGSADGEVIDNVGIGEFLWASYIMGLTAYPDNAAIASAQQAAKVYVNGNSSYTHGGGCAVKWLSVYGNRDKL